MKENNKGLIAIIIILIFLLLGLVGYIVFDKYLENENETRKLTTVTTTTAI